MNENNLPSLHNENTELSIEQQEVLNVASVPPSVDIDIENSFIPSEVFDMNASFRLSQKMYEEVLAPQLKENEDLKRKNKKTLMTNIFKILKWQFVFTYIFVTIILMGVVLSGILNISDNVILAIIKFIEFYITSIVVELISILFFIVKNVFDTSIADLIKDFDKRK